MVSRCAYGFVGGSDVGDAPALRAGVPAPAPADLGGGGGSVCACACACIGGAGLAEPGRGTAGFVEPGRGTADRCVGCDGAGAGVGRVEAGRGGGGGSGGFCCGVRAAVGRGTGTGTGACIGGGGGAWERASFCRRLASFCYTVRVKERRRKRGVRTRFLRSSRAWVVSRTRVLMFHWGVGQRGGREEEAETYAFEALEADGEGVAMGLGVKLDDAGAGLGGHEHGGREKVVLFERVFAWRGSQHHWAAGRTERTDRGCP